MINFDIGANITDAQKKIDTLTNLIGNIGQSADKAGKIIEGALNDAVPTDSFKKALSSIQTDMDKVAKEAEKVKASMAGMSEGEELESMRARSTELANELGELQMTYDMVSASSNAYVQALNGEDAAMQSHNNTLVKLLGGQEKYNAVMNALPPSVRMVITEIEGMTVASKAFIATPLGAILAALATALATLSTWFKSSSEGEMAFAEITGYVSGVLNQLKEVVIKVGGAIYNAFKDPKQAVKDLWEAIKQNIVNRIEGIGKVFKVLGEMISATFSGDFDADKWKGMGKKLADAAAEAGTGIDNLSKKVADYSKNVSDAAKKSAEYNKREKQLARDRSNWSVKEQEIDNKIAKLRNSNASGGNATKNQAEAERLVNEKYNQRIKFAKEELAIQQGRMALTTNTDADYEKENELKKNLLALEEQRTQEMLRFNRAATTANNSASRSGAKQIEKQTAELEKGKEAYAKAYTDLENEAAQADVDALKEGGEKTLKQLKANLDKRLDEIARSKAEYEQKKKDAGEGGLNSNEEGLFASLSANAVQQYNNQLDEIKKADEQYRLDYLKEYGSMQAKKAAITKEYEDKIAATDNESLKKILQKQMESALADIDMQAIQKKMDWSGLFGNLGTKTKSELASLKEELQGIISSGKFDGNIEQLQILYEKLTQIDEQLIGKNGAFGGIGMALDELEAATINLQTSEYNLKVAREMGDEAAIKAYEDEVELAKQRKNSATETLKLAKASAAQSITDMNSWFGSIQGAVNGTSYSGLFSGLTKSMPTIDGLLGSNISSLFSQLSDQEVQMIDDTISQLGTMIADLIKDGGGISEVEQSNILLSNILSYMDNIISKIEDNKNSIQESIDYYKEAQKTNEEAQALALKNFDYAASDTAAYYHSPGERFDRVFKGNWNEINAWIKANFGKDTNFRLGHSLGSFAEELNADELIALLRQFPSLTSAIEGAITHLRNDTEDASSHFGGNRLADQMETAYKNLMSLEGETDRINEALNVALSGITFDSIYSEFESLMNDMDASVEDFGENFEEVMRKAIVNGVMKNNVSPLIQTWLDNLTSALSNDGEIDASEYNSLADEYKNITDVAIKARDTALKIAGADTSSSSKISASQRSVASMSEDTASELNGRFTALQISGNSIDTNLKDLSQQIKSDSKETLRKLGEIADDTDSISKQNANTTVVAELDSNAKVRADVDTSGLQGSVDSLRTAVEGINTNQQTQEAPEVNVNVDAPQITVDTDNTQLESIIQQLTGAMTMVGSSQAQVVGALSIVNETMTSAVSEMAGVHAAINDSNTLLASINSSVLACNGTLNAIYNTNDSGFRTLAAEVRVVASAINNKL